MTIGEHALLAETLVGASFAFVDKTPLNAALQEVCDDLVAATKAHKEKAYNASAWVREAAKHIQGGGGGQPFFATAGGTNPEGLAAAIESVKAAI